MSDLSKKVSYVRGLADGLKLDKESAEGTILVKILEVLDEMAEEIDELGYQLDDIDEFTSAVADDVVDLISERDGISDPDDDYDDFMEDYDYDEDDDLYEIECPHCHEDVMIEFDMIDDDNAIICPNCHEEIPLEFDFDDDYEEE